MNYFRLIIFLFFLLANSVSSTAQNQAKADSLKRVLEQQDTLSPLSRMVILAKISVHSSSPGEIVLYSNKLLELASAHKQQNYVIEAWQSIGVAYRLMGDLKKSLASLFQSANLAIENKDHRHLTIAYLEIANTYTANHDNRNAIIYNRKAIDIIRAYGNKEELAINLLNTGYNYYILNELDSALLLYNEAAPLFDKIGLKIGKAYTVGNKALVYWKKGNYFDAEHGLILAISMLKPLGDQFGMADYYNHLGRLYSERGNIRKAIYHTGKAHDISEAENLKEQLRDASLLLSELYKTKKDYARAFAYQTKYLRCKDSIESAENTRQLANLRTDFEVSLKEKEIVLLEKRQLVNRIYIMITVFLLLLAVLILLYFRQRFLTARIITANEQKQHDENIRNLLNSQETKALQAMVQGQENERKRLAQELHNHLGSLLATIKVNMNAVDESDIPNYHTIITLVDQACSDVRNLSHSLNMGVSENFGLVAALTELTQNLQQTNKLKVEFTAAMCQRHMDARQEILIYRIIQELVSNVLKHSEANKLSILLTCFEEENLINIIVQDNGKGFNVDEEYNVHGGMGRKSLNDMISNLRGEIRFDSNHSSGTTVNIDLPLSAMVFN